MTRRGGHPTTAPSNVSISPVGITRRGCAGMWPYPPSAVLPSAKGGTWGTPVLGIARRRNHISTPRELLWKRWQQRWRKTEQLGRRLQHQPDKWAVPDRTRLFSNPRLQALTSTTAEKLSAHSDGWVLRGRKWSVVTGAGVPKTPLH